MYSLIKASFGCCTHIAPTFPLYILIASSFASFQDASLTLLLVLYQMACHSGCNTCSLLLTTFLYDNCSTSL
ncbi:hypothetical protein BC941DRAFT_444099 [Chlamydoabsidia padenii]|nr:hypothetical protein BC941DRAFT_444099 [Chlamydoabsidia padenii]